MPAETARRERPIFVLGCPRSGTTLLQMMLHAHPRIAIPPETKFVMGAYRRRRAFGDLRKASNRARVARWIINRPTGMFADMQLDPQLIVDRVTAAPPTFGSLIAVIFKAYAEKHGRPRWGDKRPYYYQDVMTLRRLFPDAQFVHIVRDGRDSAASLLKMPWFGGDAYGATGLWREALTYTRGYARRLPKDSWYELHYEQLVSDPVPELQRLCSFLGEQFHPVMATPQDVASEVLPSRQRAAHHARTLQPVDPSRTGVGRTQLQDWELDLFEWANGDLLRRHGYAVRDDVPRPAAEVRAHWRRHYRARQRVRRRRLLKDRYVDLRLHRPLADRTD